MNLFPEIHKDISRVRGLFLDCNWQSYTYNHVWKKQKVVFNPSARTENEKLTLNIFFEPHLLTYNNKRGENIVEIWTKGTFSIENTGEFVNKLTEIPKLALATKLVQDCLRSCGVMTLQDENAYRESFTAPFINTNGKIQVSFLLNKNYYYEPLSIPNILNNISC